MGDGEVNFFLPVAETVHRCFRSLRHTPDQEARVRSRSWSRSAGLQIGRVYAVS
jgi:hypothetical protein